MKPLALPVRFCEFSTGTPVSSHRQSGQGVLGNTGPEVFGICFGGDPVLVAKLEKYVKKMQSRYGC